MQLYTVKQNNIQHRVEANSIEEVRKWCLDNLDHTKQAWITYEEGMREKVVAGFNFRAYRCDYGEVFMRSTNYFCNKAGYFKTKQEAWNDYNQHNTLAQSKLDAVEAGIKDVLGKHGADLSFYYEGDSHGIQEEKIIVSVCIARYTYIRTLDFD